MSYTQTLVANICMGHLGDREIADIDDSFDPDAITLKEKYAHARDTILTAHDWKWAKRVVELQRTPATPTVRYTYTYSLPSGYARLVNVSKYSTMEPQLDEFDIVDGKLTTDAENVFMEFVANDWSEAVWPPHFADCVGLKLAILTCNKITHNMVNKVELNKTLMREALPYARSVDSQGQPARQRFIRSNWTRARFGGRNIDNLRKNA